MEALNEDERLEKLRLFELTKKKKLLTPNTFSIFVLNVWLLSKYCQDIEKDYRLINNGVLTFTETQLASSQSVLEIKKAFSKFEMHLTDNESRF